MIRTHGWFRLMLTASLVGLTIGCSGGSGEKASNTGGSTASATNPMPDPLEGRTEPLATPGGTSTSAMVRAVVRGFGSVPFDNLTLPLVSPDGRLIATQTGAPPTWATVLASSGSAVPTATRIAVFALDTQPPRTDANGRPQPSLPPEQIAKVSQPALLGRTSSVDGFLIEVPQPSGARWLGRASWMDGAVSWIAQDTAVNAFAADGPNGAIAWSSREPSATEFELVVKGPGYEWGLKTDDVSWLLPTWSNTGEHLFVFMLEASGDLFLAHGAAVSADAFIQSLQRIPVARPGTVEIAYQCMVGAAACTAHGSVRDQIVFFDPIERRSTVWRPFESDRQRLKYLAERSFAALIDDGDFALVSIHGEIIRQNLTDLKSRTSLVSGTAVVARPTTSEGWPYLLLAPGERSVGITGMRLLDVSASSGGQ